jgi:hypothetical protein
MGVVSVWHWLIVILWLAAFIVPLWRLLPRAGIPAWVALFGLIPFAIIVLWWVLAFKRWPGDASSQLDR